MFEHYKRIDGTEVKDKVDDDCKEGIDNDNNLMKRKGKKSKMNVMKAPSMTKTRRKKIFKRLLKTRRKK